MGILDIFKRSKPHRRSYAAVNSGRLFADFAGSNKSADSEIHLALREMRNRSRDLERNNEYFKRYLQLLRTNVVGEGGFKVQLKGRNPDGSVDMAGNNIIEAAWKEWCRVGGPTIDGRMSMTDLSNHVISAMARDGEVFLMIVKDKGLRHNLSLQVIEPDRIDEEYNDTTRVNPIRMGIELDGRTHRPIAYHVMAHHTGDNDFATMSNGKKYIRVPADKMIHIFRPERAGQTRGVPWSSAAIASLKMLHGYREAELIAARVGAAKMGFFTSPAGDGFSGDGIDSDGAAPVYDAEAGTFHQLPAGVGFEAFDPSHPTGAFASFEKAVLRGIAGGLGVSYTSLANDLESTSYSSIRQGTQEERDFYRTLHRFMIDHFLDPVFRVWLSHVMDFEVVPIYGTGKFEKFTTNMTWRGRGWQWVDPLKEMNAAVVGLQNGIISHTDIAATYGRDAEETFAQIQRDKETAKAFGLMLAFEPFGDTLPVPTAEEAEEPHTSE